VTSNETFHSAIARGSRNPRLHSLVMRHLEECARLFYMGTRIRDINPETINDHHRIVAVLRQRDSEKGRLAMIEHNENTRKGLLAAMVADAQSGISL
jgi:DNA-binding GntR family transcriptional regulator